LLLLYDHRVATDLLMCVANLSQAKYCHARPACVEQTRSLVCKRTKVCKQAWFYLHMLMEDKQLQDLQYHFSTHSDDCISNQCNDRHHTIGITHLAKTTHLINIRISTKRSISHHQLGLLLACDIALTQSLTDVGHRCNVASGGWALTSGALSCSQWCLTWSP